MNPYIPVSNLLAGQVIWLLLIPVFRVKDHGGVCIGYGTQGVCIANLLASKIKIMYILEDNPNKRPLCCMHRVWYTVG